MEDTRWNLSTFVLICILFLALLAISYNTFNNNFNNPQNTPKEEEKE